MGPGFSVAKVQELPILPNVSAPPLLLYHLGKRSWLWQLAQSCWTSFLRAKQSRPYHGWNSPYPSYNTSSMLTPLIHSSIPRSEISSVDLKAPPRRRDNELKSLTRGKILISLLDFLLLIPVQKSQSIKGFLYYKAMRAPRWGTEKQIFDTMLRLWSPQMELGLFPDRKRTLTGNFAKWQLVSRIVREKGAHFTIQSRSFFLLVCSWDFFGEQNVCSVSNPNFIPGRFGGTSEDNHDESQKTSTSTATTSKNRRVMNSGEDIEVVLGRIKNN